MLFCHVCKAELGDAKPIVRETLRGTRYFCGQSCFDEWLRSVRKTAFAETQVPDKEADVDPMTGGT
jgi:hypothetical protein